MQELAHALVTVCRDLSQIDIDPELSRPDEASQASLLKTEIGQSLAGKQVVAEYSDPNPFKVLHARHLYTSVVGDPREQQRLVLVRSYADTFKHGLELLNMPAPDHM